MSYDKLPRKLKEETTFCLYKLEPGKDGKKKKVPYQTCGARADPGNKAHLTAFTTAYETYRKDGYDGISLSVMEELVAVDIDDCIVDGMLNAFAQEIVDKLGTYAEPSPSGTGVHIWGRISNLLYDTAKYYMKNSEIGLEVYVGKHTTRFLTFTGEAINELGVNDCSEALQEVLNTYMVRPMAKVHLWRHREGFCRISPLWQKGSLLKTQKTQKAYGKGKSRRDSKRRVLRPGESMRADGKYQYKYHIDGKPHFVYSWKLEPTDKLLPGKKSCLSLRELVKQVNSDCAPS